MIQRILIYFCVNCFYRTHHYGVNEESTCHYSSLNPNWTFFGSTCSDVPDCSGSSGSIGYPERSCGPYCSDSSGLSGGSSAVCSLKNFYESYLLLGNYLHHPNLQTYYTLTTYCYQVNLSFFARRLSNRDKRWQNSNYWGTIFRYRGIFFHSSLRKRTFHIYAPWLVSQGFLPHRNLIPSPAPIILSSTRSIPSSE